VCCLNRTSHDEQEITAVGSGGVKGREHVIAITAPAIKRQFFLSCSSDAERADWLLALTSASVLDISEVFNLSQYEKAKSSFSCVFVTLLSLSIQRYKRHVRQRERFHRRAERMAVRGNQINHSSITMLFFERPNEFRVCGRPARRAAAEESKAYSEATRRQCCVGRK
jgi:hypothetical protein